MKGVITIPVQKLSGQVQQVKIPAAIFGVFALHRLVVSISDGQAVYDPASWTVTHVPTGRSFVPYWMAGMDACDARNMLRLLVNIAPADWWAFTDPGALRANRPVLTAMQRFFTAAYAEVWQ